MSETKKHKPADATPESTSAPAGKKPERMFTVCTARQRLQAIAPKSTYQIPSRQPEGIPWGLMKKYEELVKVTHKRSLEDLSDNRQREGLTIQALASMFRGERKTTPRTDDQAVEIVNQAIEEYLKA